MDKLIYIIGEAPSELSLNDLRNKLTDERTRVRTGLNYFRQYTQRRSGTKPKKAGQSTKLKALMSETGLSPKEILRAIEILKQQKNSPESDGDK